MFLRSVLNIRNKLFLIFVVIASNLSVFSGGTMVTWSSPVLPKLKSINAQNMFGKILNPTEQALLTSLPHLGAALGPIMGGIFTNRIGRKNTLIIFTGMPLIIATITMIFSRSLILCIVARFLGGLCIGSCYAVLPIYMAEISEPSYRGIVSSAMNISIVLGQLFTDIIGSFVSIMTLNIVCAVSPILFMITFPFCPESPYYLVSRKDMAMAEKALAKLRNKTVKDVQKEVELIKDFVEDKNNNCKGSFKDLFLDKKCRKSMGISLGLFTFMHFSGLFAILSYTSDIFRAANTVLDSNICAIVVATVQVLGSFITPLIIDRLGRKKILFLSALGMCLSEIPLGAYYYLKEHNFSVENIYWLPITCLVTYMVTFISGFGAISWIFMSEILPLEIKTLGSTIASMYCAFGGFVVSSVFLYLIEWLGIGGTFWFFSACCFFAILFVVFCVFETKGKSFQEIQNILNN